MKAFILSLFMAPLFTSAQKLYLMDRKFQQPLLEADMVVMKDVSKGLMPIHVADTDAVIKSIVWLSDSIDNGKLNTEEFKQLNAGNTRCIARVEQNGAFHKYNVVLNTKVGSMTTSMVVVARENSKRALQRLSILADYLKNNRAALSGSQ